MKMKAKPNRTFSLADVSCTRLYVILQGILAGFCGIGHGISEISMGNTPTGGHIMATVGAFTLIENYLFTGIATILVAALVVVWAVGFIHKKNGPAVFLLLCIVLFLVGGGIAQTVFFLIAWGVSTRIGKPLGWWQKVLPEKARKRMAKSWPALFIIGYVLLYTAVGIWLLLTPPGIAHTVTTVDYTLWAFLAAGLVFQALSIITGFARDIERRNIPQAKVKRRAQPETGGRLL